MLFLFFGVIVLAVAGALWSEVARSGPTSLRAFGSYVAAVVRRNLPLADALRAWADDLPGRATERGALEGMARRLDEGWSLADALDSRPGRYPETFRALVRAGERGGNLAAVLDGTLTLFDFDSRTLRRGLLFAVYPLAVTFVVLAVGEVVGGQFLAIMADLGLPPPDLRLLEFARTAAGIGVQVLGAAVVLGWLGRATVAPSLRWHVPVVRRWERPRAVASAALVAARLLQAGVPLPEALRLAASASGSRRCAAILQDAAAAVEEGTPLAAALERADRRRELPVAFGWYMRNGEASGDLPLALERAAEHSAARSRVALDAAVRGLLPLGVLAAASVIAIACHTMVAGYLLIARELLGW